MNSAGIKIYVRIWAALLILLGLTCLLARLDLGPLNVVAALAIAGAKMLLVILFFMHVRHESRLTWIFVAAGFICLLIMFDLTLGDYLTRASVPGIYRQSWENSANSSQVRPESESAIYQDKKPARTK